MSIPIRRYDWDYSDYARLPDDGNHYEVLDGELLVTPSPSTDHQYVMGRLYRVIDDYVTKHRLGIVIMDVDLLFQTGQFLRPDMLVVPESSRAGIKRRGIEVAPSLVVEILSPASSGIDLVKKPARYGDFGIPEYWVFDPEDKSAWIWRFAEGARTAEQVRGALQWHPAGATEPLVIDLEAVLAPI
ncbi:MAG: Uma2 family endonuclease [Gemmatimonadetes bacterium]|nr:Uma2 family endonuclease [Gemmatimonadota bacterium]